jgi:hypothetical protein
VWKRGFVVRRHPVEGVEGVDSKRIAVPSLVHPTHPVATTMTVVQRVRTVVMTATAAVRMDIPAAEYVYP